MTTEWCSARSLAFAALVLVSTSVAQTATVRGRIDRYDPPDIVTVSHVKVVRCQGSARLDSTTTGQDGMYYFPRVPAGAYRLEIMPPPGDSFLRSFELGFEVPPGRPKVDIPAQLLNRLVFEQPAVDAPVPTGDTVRAEGTHSFPSGTTVWFLFNTGAARYHFSGDTAVLTAGRPWSVRLGVPQGATRLVAVLATLEARADFAAKAAQKFSGDLEGLPDGTRTVAARRFTEP
ncbi:MAG: hypothetical protein NTX53_11020 [candidate division WOR-3 bacterium]|nr:hypothetical protein [candidate division WOR-3 bacterium]